MGARKNDAEPAMRKKGRINKPIKIPNRDRIGPVMKNCIMMDIAPDMP